MARINLLPWREAQRKEQQREFVSITAFSAALTVILVGFIHIHINGMIEYQERRNSYLENEIRVLDDKIKEIKKLESTKKALLERMAVIENLQATRPGIVHLFDELVNSLPEGVYLTSAKQSGERLDLFGKAESNARVSAYMRNIDASGWLADPTLNVIETSDQGAGRISTFHLQAKQAAPKTSEKSEE